MKKYQKIISLLLVSILFFNFSNVAFAVNLQTIKTSESEQILFKSKIAATQDDTTLTIKSIKVALDFSGNKYTVIECNPIGYYIYHNDSGIFTEYSVSSPSPYAGLTDTIYYGGPTYYYTKEGENYVHTVLGTTVSASNTSKMATSCNENVAILIDHRDIATLNALQSRSANNIELFQEITRSTPIYLKTNPDFFAKMNGDAVGYYCPPGSNGICGYIAANMLLRYWASRGKVNLDSKYTTTSGVKNAILTKELYAAGGTLGFGDGTIASDIAAVLNYWSSLKPLPIAAGWGLFAFDVYGEVDNDRPSILFGDLDGAGKHAVLVYGYTRDGSGASSPIANFGWSNAGYEKVTITGLFGSNVNYKP